MRRVTRRFTTAVAAVAVATGGVFGLTALPSTAATVDLFDSSSAGADSSVVPAGICFVTITAEGGSGGVAGGDRPGGIGGRISARVPVDPFTTLDIMVAGKGGGASEVASPTETLVVAGGGGGRSFVAASAIEVSATGGTGTPIVTIAYDPDADACTASGAPTGVVVDRGNPQATVSLTPPGTPTGVVVDRGNTQATVSFTPPASDGGLPVLDYTATCGSQSTTGAGSPLVVTGLENGVTVNCTVTARYEVGPGSVSSRSKPVKPATVPDPPLNVSVIPGDTEATVRFAKPASNGGSGLLDYTATCGSQSTTGTGSSLVVTGLTDTGVPCTVTARNVIGVGPASAPAVPVTAPVAPRGVSVTPGDTQATVVFFKPLSNGGIGIDSYTATCGSKSATGTGSSLVVTGLTNGETVSCTVTATNVVGTGPASSPSVPVSPGE